VSWCDKLASTPSAGFRLTPSFIPSSATLANLTEMFNGLCTDEKPTFNIELMDPFALAFNTEPGYRYSADPMSAAVSFNHRMRAVPTSGGPPVMELISKPAPYTSLLGEVNRRLAEFVKLLPVQKGRAITRVGIVSTTNVDFDDAPPGIQEILNIIPRPLGGDFHFMNSSIGTIIKSTSHYVDRCTHSMSVPEDKSGMINLNFDWQRTFNNPVIIAGNEIDRILREAENSALAYFEKLAEGGLSDGSNG